MALLVYNTLSNKKEPFKPIEDGFVKIYLCGPTVYDFLHIGNFRGAITFNIIRNWLEASGYKVTFVYNYTDVDDKIIKRANDEGVTSSVISERYIQEFEKDFAQLGLRKHDHNPRVTEYMPQIIELIQDILKNKKAYEVDGEIFYAIDEYKTYGQLSKKKLDELEAGQRVEVDKRKRNPFDFVLWKPSKPGEPMWDSPWGKGRPGWHIECSAMIKAILGDTIDIHGGGIDLIFPHHENEIAQGEGATGCKYCNYWVHNNFINMGDEKMSKSLGNVFKARDFMKMYHPEILKYLFLSAHYRSMLTVSDEKILQTISALKRIYSALEIAQTIYQDSPGEAVAPDSGFQKILETLTAKITKGLNDDFNTADFIANIFEATRAFNALKISMKRQPVHKATAKLFLDWMANYGKISALFAEEPAPILNRLDDILLTKKNLKRTDIEALIAKREEARAKKDFQAADELKKQLSSMGIELYDGSLRTWSVSEIAN
ncbi:MAG: cysteine--tRNA ligase [Bacteriovoracaceae bacterium]|nr:cysteine--tRNA ligase [Bacteriovoracaceae bacterium]